MMENWKVIPRYQGLYEASDCGDIRSVPRRVRSVHTNGRKIPGVALKTSLISGYPAVSLSVGNVAVKRYVHELVLEAFIGPRPRGMQSRHHPDPDKTNNNLSNLLWGTPAENMGDYFGKYLTDDDIEDMRKLWNEGALQKEIADKFSCTQGYVSSVFNGKRRAS